LRSAYPVFVGGKVYQMTPAQILLLVAKGLRSGNLSEISPLEIENVAPPRSEAGEWAASLKVLDRKGYLRLADGVVEHFSLTGRAPDNLLLDGAVVRFRDILYTLLRVARDSRDGAMPENLLILPVPSGTLMRENSDVPAKYSYYLLSDAYVKTGTEKVREVLDNFLENLSLRSLAEEICNWTGSNITYRFFPLPPTSEETLKERKGQCRDFTNVYLALARTVGLPARRMLGWVTSTWQPPAGWGFISTTTPEGKTIALHAWVEVFIPGEGWLPLEPQSHRPALYFGDLPYEVYRRLPQSWMGAMAGYESAAGRI
ncbi:MAG: transglutaminase-like domain-containing protein, partial [Candidatus Hadarchaeales archaeon]